MQAENAKLRREVAELEKMLAGIRSANTQLVNQSQLTTTTQNIEVYSAPEILKLERDVQEMEGKNRRLREVLTSMGVTTTQAYDGAVTVVENREVEYQLQHERVALEQQSKQELEQQRVVVGQQYSMRQVPTDISNAIPVDQLRNSSYRDIKDSERGGRKSF